MTQLLRKGHFLGAKLRSVRKRNGLTLEELSSRCIQRDAKHAPSVSYLSMIESGKRAPSTEMLELLAEVFQRDPEWFLDESADLELPTTATPSAGAAKVPLEPAFLFSKDVLQAAIPELLAQTGTSGRQFAHLLIRSHQEMSRNDFPDLERAADGVGERRFPLSVEDLQRLCKRHGLEIRWFERKPVLARDKDREVRSMVRSFFEPPRVIYANRALQSDPPRLKFDLAAHIAHKVLHGGDGLKSAHATGGEMGGSPEGSSDTAGMNAQESAKALRLGASGIFLKQGPLVTLAQAIRLVAGGAVWVDQDIIRDMAEHVAAQDTRVGPPRLTEREQQVLQGILEGLANKEIGARLGLSESAVKASLQQLFRKTGVRTRAQLVRVALDRAFTTPRS